ncbi:MAG: FeoB small GTPase domain-containing protein [Candidatus Nanopelagicales bacterium]|nr:FeoB small GTPase domain-containing protein [Candidatus Nanopelagicales bacterium]
MSTGCHDDGGSAAVATGVRVALVGSPNAGKTTLFNALTGLRAKTGNYPGVTVTRRIGIAKIDGEEITIEDLPGTYSLEPVSPDEQVVRDLLDGNLGNEGPPDAVMVVVDATTIERSLILVSHDPDREGFVDVVGYVIEDSLRVQPERGSDQFRVHAVDQLGEPGHPRQSGCDACRVNAVNTALPCSSVDITATQRQDQPPLLALDLAEAARELLVGQEHTFPPPLAQLPLVL